VQSFDEALELSPGNPLVLNNYAYYLSLRNYRMDDAERMASQAFEKQPNSPSIQDTYGWILYLKGDLANAKRYIGKAVESDGGAEVLEHYGDVLMKLGEVENAKSNWQKALDQGATNFSIAEKLQQFKQP
jgi:Tfp pilus assembly protein PilF